MPIARKKLPLCPIEVTISAVSARWKARIVWRLAEAPASFTSLRESVAGISDRMLTAQLAELASDGVVASAATGTLARYDLTPLGRDLVPVLEVLQRWGEVVIERRSQMGAQATLPPASPQLLVR